MPLEFLQSVQYFRRSEGGGGARNSPPPVGRVIKIPQLSWLSWGKGPDSHTRHSRTNQELLGLTVVMFMDLKQFVPPKRVEHFFYKKKEL